MAFVLPDDVEDIAQVLRDLEPQAPKPFKSTLIKAARLLDDFEALCLEGAQALELAASLKAGQMDSQSRADEIATQQRLTMTALAARMRALV